MTQNTQIKCFKYTQKALDELNALSISGIASDWLHKDNEWEYKFYFVYFIQNYILKLNVKEK